LLFVMALETKKKITFCKKCVLSSNLPGVVIKDGKCSVCLAEEELEKRFSRKEYIEKMKGVFAQAKAKKRCYDVVVLFSGGKDSSYLIHLLKNTYKLRVLALAIIHPLVNGLSLKNMEEISGRLGVELMKFYIDGNLFKKYLGQGIKLSFNDKMGPIRLAIYAII